MVSKVKVVLRDYYKREYLDYNIIAHDNPLARDWVDALKGLLSTGNPIEKNYCWHGWPNTDRTLGFLCGMLNRHIEQINDPKTQQRWITAGCEPYIIEEYFTENSVRFPSYYGTGLTEELKKSGAVPEMHLALSLKHGIMNQLHNHFEILQGTVEQLSKYYKTASDDTKYAIRQLNLLCHEIESLCLSQRKFKFDPKWIRPSQITTWLLAPRHELKSHHRELFNVNEYDREFGGVYMHWCQIGKTLYEVWRDENAPDIDKTTCDAITELQYYSGEFDIEWGRSVTRKDQWHQQEQARFKSWLEQQGYDPNDNAGLSLGYLPLGQVDIKGSFGTDDFLTVIKEMGYFLDIYKIEVDGVSATYDYHWIEPNWMEKQIEFLRPGYRHSSK